LEWTSQFYLNNSINQLVCTKPPYINQGPVDMMNEEDFIFYRAITNGLFKTKSGQHLMLMLSANEQQGYLGPSI
jgi:hypothetical protein